MCCPFGLEVRGSCAFSFQPCCHRQCTSGHVRLVQCICRLQHLKTTAVEVDTVVVYEMLSIADVSKSKASSTQFIPN